MRRSFLVALLGFGTLPFTARASTGPIETVWVDPGPTAPDVRFRVVRTVYSTPAAQVRLTVAWQAINLSDTPFTIDPNHLVVRAATRGHPSEEIPPNNAAAPWVLNPQTTSPIQLSAYSLSELPTGIGWGQDAHLPRWLPFSINLAPYRVGDAQIMEMPEPLEARLPTLATKSTPVAFSVLRRTATGCAWERHSGDTHEVLMPFNRNCTRLPVALDRAGQRAVASHGRQLEGIDMAAHEALNLNSPGHAHLLMASFDGTDHLITQTLWRLAPNGAAHLSLLRAGVQDANGNWRVTHDDQVEGVGDSIYSALGMPMVRAGSCQLVHAGIRDFHEGLVRTYGECTTPWFGPVARAVSDHLSAPTQRGHGWVSLAANGADVVAWMPSAKSEAATPLSAPVYFVRSGVATPVQEFAQTPEPSELHGLRITVHDSYALIGGWPLTPPPHTPDQRSWEPFRLYDVRDGTRVRTFDPDIVDVAFWPEH